VANFLEDLGKVAGKAENTGRKAGGLNYLLRAMKARNVGVLGARYELQIAAKYADQGATKIGFRKALGKQGTAESTDLDLLVELQGKTVVIEAKKSAKVLNIKDATAYLTKLAQSKEFGSLNVEKVVFEIGEQVSVKKQASLKGLFAKVSEKIAGELRDPPILFR
jgi:hypothetical protein